jgi:hypothetical protein
MKIGDKVVWISSWTEKRGVIIADIPAGTSVRKHIPASAKRSHSKIDKDKSTIDRMLVAVKAGKEGQITHYYAPRKSLLKVVEED